MGEGEEGTGEGQVVKASKDWCRWITEHGQLGDFAFTARLAMAFAVLMAPHHIAYGQP